MEISLPIFPTAYLPSVLYLAYVAKFQSIAIERMETFPKQTFRNRMTIATGNGVQTLTVPVVRPYGNHTRTEDMEIGYGESWHIRHWRAIVTAYNTSPFFLYYQDDLEKILMARHTLLINLNDSLLHFLLQKLKINCDICYTEDYTPASPTLHDYRYTLANKRSTIQYSLPPYSQVFDTRIGFQPNMSGIDLLFNLGPEAGLYIKSLASSIGEPLA